MAQALNLTLSLALSLTLVSCGSDSSDLVETLQVQQDEFVISLIAEGELRAAESTPIKPPQGGNNARTISWMAPNHGFVKEGEVIARFDTSNSEQEALKTGIEINKVDIQVVTIQRELERLLEELGNDLDIVDIEKIMADQFVIEDSLAYSRFEIIDATRDKELLMYREGHLEGKKGSHSRRQSAEIEVLDAIRDKQEVNNTMHTTLVENSAVRAPHDGYFVYEKNWWGQQVDVGSTVFPRNFIGQIPNLNKMEAVLQVLETEAIGLATGQKVDIVLDAFPDRPLTGVLESISATAQPISRDNPVKYFMVTVALDHADPEWITPEAQVSAEIHISRVVDAIAVPNQALFQDDSGDWVLLRDGRDLKKQPVTLGLRGANRSQIVTGLNTGDEIALYPPDLSDT
jgi:multidrug efflux pump subunit AcrA (membrane-fusion protein)